MDLRQSAQLVDRARHEGDPLLRRAVGGGDLAGLALAQAAEGGLNLTASGLVA
jgi:hypothetical protein